MNMIGSYGSGINKPHTDIEIAKARKALGLLKAHREKSETAAQRIGSYILKSNETSYPKKGASHMAEFGAKPGNSYYRKVFDPNEFQEEDKIFSKGNSKFSQKEGIGTGSRLQKINANLNKLKISNPEPKSLSHLANLGKNAISPTQGSKNNKPPLRRPREVTTKQYEPEVQKSEEDDDRPIRQSNGNNQKPLEYEEASAITGECRYCHRKFNPESLEKHEGVCIERPDKKKRKKFETSKKRLISKEQQALVKQGEKAAKPNKKVASWKQKSNQLRAAIKPSDNDGEGRDGVVEENPNYRQCPTCGRSFNEEAAKRHIPFCANRAKLESIKNYGKAKQPKANYKKY